MKKIICSGFPTLFLFSIGEFFAEWQKPISLKNNSLQRFASYFVGPSGKASNFLKGDFYAVLGFMDAEKQKQKLILSLFKR